ncbi:MAG: Crp/Fnr family transcriptional regulator [Gammaproteobacteria bacterium]|nr:MAG: Crp/Fnr family transcriptional regulator [Gammaproteobacteria bacterium]
MPASIAPTGQSAERQALGFEDSLSQAALSTALVSVFRGKFCDAILPNRKAVAFKKEQVIYDVRKAGDVVGELCASELQRLDRAVALEPAEAIPVPFEEVMEAVRERPDLLTRLVDVFCRALSEAYAQVNTLAVDDTAHRLAKVLLKLAAKIGQHSGSEVEIPTYLTQEEIAQMVAVRRERISTALNFFRRKRLIQYTNHGHLVLNVSALESYVS